MKLSKSLSSGSSLIVTLTASFALMAGTGITAHAQQRLTFQQTQGKVPSLSKTIGVISGWSDDSHYIETSPGSQQMYAVDIRSGERKAYTPPPKSNVNVMVKDKDVYIQYGKDEPKKLTTDTAEEKNPTLSPDGKYVAFTRNSDLYAVEVASGKEIRYTTDATDVIYNGYSSWVYFEEILGRPTKYKAFWWAPDSKHLAFMRFDDTKVPMFPIYGSTGQHGYTEKTRYPKAGDPNPEVKIGFVPAAGGAVVWADFNEKDDQYFGTPYWSFDGSSLMVQWMNRGQDNLKFYTVKPETGAKKEIYDEKQPSWVDLDYDGRITYLEDKKHYILKSDKTGWAHYYLYTLDGKLLNPLTSGKWQVTNLLQVDEKNKVVYFTARKEASTRTDLYRVNYNGKGLKRLTFGEYSHQVKISPTGKYFITTYSNVTTPVKQTLLDNTGKVIKEIADSKSAGFASYNIGKTEMITIPTDDGYNLPAVITYPVDFDQTKTYPVVFSMYGGPDAGTVTNTWKGTANQWWANEGIIQISVDHRASGQFGKEGVALMHRNLGKWEMKDYITAAKWLKSKSWVNQKKLLITGHSYGGYMTSMALTYGADYFDFGYAGAPVTSWELYDSAYTERFMDTPQENPEGYKNASVLTYVDQYKGLLRIMHADMDDNVHMQNTIQFINKMEDANKHFELMIYPGGRHGWSATVKGKHDFTERARFYYQNLLEKAVPDELLK
ncbi:DPP IV N-terminal domain-containing protein [Pedobacter sp. MC2016-15]|uniref:DPP IV N-terminal domain-containing protein n=1 Tax=Pedobacter sp. MC2016-15 TaxID=2994473 RepID=UPI0022479479|nr:DPP IV N-terminal domain-containing protein [Pedobacter sp. MC2016-15]MCX2478748.1 DPP IV N-terminal domain-containing protein [Pedobacter sp. MC2016-15]